MAKYLVVNLDILYPGHTERKGEDLGFIYPKYVLVTPYEFECVCILDPD